MRNVQTMTFQKSEPGFLEKKVNGTKPLKPKKSPGARFRKNPEHNEQQECALPAQRPRYVCPRLDMHSALDMPTLD